MPPADFEASIRFLTPEEGGRLTPVRQGYLPTFNYSVNDPEGDYIICLELLNQVGREPLHADTEVPQGAEVCARIGFLNDDLRRRVHRSRIQVGLMFNLREGFQVVAVGTVTKIMHLFDDRPKS